jgi:hypothetical protein
VHDLERFLCMSSGGAGCEGGLLYGSRPACERPSSAGSATTGAVTSDTRASTEAVASMPCQPAVAIRGCDRVGSPIRRLGLVIRTLW